MSRLRVYRKECPRITGLFVQNSGCNYTHGALRDFAAARISFRKTRALKDLGVFFLRLLEQNGCLTRPDPLGGLGGARRPPSKFLSLSYEELL
jgi:hypothetical protein